MEYTFYYNDINSLDYGLHITGNPEIDAPEDDIEEVEVPGRDGVLIKKNNRKKPVTISLPCNTTSSASYWWDSFRQIKDWLTDSGILQFDDDTEHFYKVLNCTVTSHKRDHWKTSTLTAKFTCEPYMYLVSGQSEYDPDDVLENPYDICHPIYTIKGSGNCTLTVNGNSMSAAVNGTLIIDTEREIAYTSDLEVSNTAVTGDYAGLYLISGTNTIDIASSDDSALDFDITVQPNWRCR